MRRNEQYPDGFGKKRSRCIFGYSGFHKESRFGALLALVGREGFWSEDHKLAAVHVADCELLRWQDQILCDDRLPTFGIELDHWKVARKR